MASGQGGGRLIIVSGMHRSGTSALTRVLNLLGAQIPEPIVPAFRGNELGHWEPEAVVHMNDRLLAEAGSYVNAATPVRSSWFDSPAAERGVDEIARYLEPWLGAHPLVVVKDPRIALLAPLWRRAVERLGVAPRFVIAFRAPGEVAASLARRQLSFFPDEMWTSDRGVAIWLNHVLELERATRGAARSFVSFDGLLADWRGEIDRLAAQLETPLPIAGREADVDVSIRPEAKRELATRSEALPGAVRRVFDQLLACTSDPDAGAGVFAAADAELAGAGDLLGSYLSQLEARVDVEGGWRRRAERAEDDLRAAREAQADLERRVSAIGRAGATRARRGEAAARAEADTLREALLVRAGEGEAAATLAAAHARAEQDRRADRLETLNAALAAAQRDRANDARAQHLRQARALDEAARRGRAIQAEAAEAVAAAERRSRTEVAAAEQRAEAMAAAAADARERLDQAERRMEGATQAADSATAKAREHAATAARARLSASAAEAGRQRDAQAGAHQLDAVRRDREAIMEELSAEVAARRSAQARARELEDEIAHIHESRSWRLTAPLRRLRASMKR